MSQHPEALHDSLDIVLLDSRFDKSDKTCYALETSTDSNVFFVVQAAVKTANTSDDSSEFQEILFNTKLCYANSSHIYAEPFF